MYSIGAKIVHPAYGAGTIVRIQEKTLGECRNCYYIIESVPGPHEMHIMVPVDHATDIGLRPIGQAKQLRTWLDLAGTPPPTSEVIHDFRARKSSLLELLKSGSFLKVTHAVRMLYFLGTEHPLSMTDRFLLDQGKQILASELALATEATLEAAMEEIEAKLESMAPMP